MELRLTLRVKQNLHFEQDTGEELHQVLDAQQAKSICQREVCQWELRCSGPLTHDGLVDAVELQGASGRRERDFIEHVVHVAFQRQRRWREGDDGPVQLRQEAAACVHEGHGRDQTQRFRDVQRVSLGIITGRVGAMTPA